MLRDIVRSTDGQDLTRRIISFALFVILLTFLLRFLWNTALVPHISILKPVDSLLNTFLLALAISMFR